MTQPPNPPQPPFHPQPGFPPGHGQPQPQPAGGPRGEIVLHLQPPPGLLADQMTTPILHIDGFPAAASWGSVALVAPAGTRTVDVRAKYVFEYGAASLAVPVQPGQQTHVFYTPPMVTFLKGAIGLEPQKRPGLGALVAVLGGIVLLFVLAVVLIAVLS